MLHTRHMHRKIGANLVESGPQERAASEGKALKDIVSGIGAPQKCHKSHWADLKRIHSHIALPVCGTTSSMGTRRFTPQKSRGGRLDLLPDF